MGANAVVRPRLPERRLPRSFPEAGVEDEPFHLCFELLRHIRKKAVATMLDDTPVRHRRPAHYRQPGGHVAYYLVRVLLELAVGVPPPPERDISPGHLLFPAVELPFPVLYMARSHPLALGVEDDLRRILLAEPLQGGAYGFVLVKVFFQAEDVIRDDLVTGVQTCALPIFPSASTMKHEWPCQVIFIYSLRSKFSAGSRPQPALIQDSVRIPLRQCLLS